MLRHRLEADFNDISLTPSCNKRSFPKESVQLASQEGLAFFASHDCEELNSALTFALDTTARAWLMSRAEGLQALACWRSVVGHRRSIQFGHRRSNDLVRGVWTWIPSVTNY